MQERVTGGSSEPPVTSPDSAYYTAAYIPFARIKAQMSLYGVSAQKLRPLNPDLAAWA